MVAYWSVISCPKRCFLAIRNSFGKGNPYEAISPRPTVYREGLPIGFFLVALSSRHPRYPRISPRFAPNLRMTGKLLIRTPFPTTQGKRIQQLCPRKLERIRQKDDNHTIQPTNAKIRRRSPETRRAGKPRRSCSQAR